MEQLTKFIVSRPPALFNFWCFCFFCLFPPFYFLGRVSSLDAVFFPATQPLCYLKYLFYLLSYIYSEKKGLIRQKKGLVRQKKGLVRQKKGLVRQKERFDPSKERVFINYFFICFIFIT